MFRKVSILTAVVLVLSACQLQAAVINSSWVGGSQGEWGNANNWNPPIVPDNNELYTFVVTIDSTSLGADEEIEVYIIENRTINQLDCYGEVDLESGTPFRIILTLSDVNGLTNYDEFSITGQSQQIEIHGNLTNSEQANLWFDSVEIHGDVYNNTESILEVEGENDIHNGDLQNDGTVVIGPASDLLVDRNIRNTGLIQLFDGECGCDQIFDNNSTGVVKGFGVVWVDQLQNKGQITAYGGSLAISINSTLINEGVLGNHPLSSLHIKPVLDVNNQGTIEVNAGGGVTFDCNLVNEPNGVISLLGGALAATTITQKENANFAGFGGITGDVVIDTNGIIKLTGSTNIVGNVTIEGTLEISDGVTLITGQTVCNGTIHIKGGYLIPQGGLSGDCNIIWEPGTYTNPADFNLDGKVNFGDFAYFAETWLWQTSWQ